MKAASKGHVEVAKSLLEAGANKDGLGLRGLVNVELRGLGWVELD